MGAARQFLKLRNLGIFPHNPLAVRPRKTAREAKSKVWFKNGDRHHGTVCFSGCFPAQGSEPVPFLNHAKKDLKQPQEILAAHERPGAFVVAVQGAPLVESRTSIDGCRRTRESSWPEVSSLLPPVNRRLTEHRAQCRRPALASYRRSGRRSFTIGSRSKPRKSGEPRQAISVARRTPNRSAIDTTAALG